MDLQKLCFHILRHDSLRYGIEKDKIHGILFDGAWLWEEYLNTLLRNVGFKHSENKLQKGQIKMFEDPKGEEIICRNSRKLYPDFYKDNFILDAKYKHLNQGIGREDLYQVVTYMYCTKAENGGYIYPEEFSDEMSTYKLAGYGGFMYFLPVIIPNKVFDYHEFVEKMRNSEKILKDRLLNIEWRNRLSHCF
jgi:5-methylcytosine-specific restriction endonuclease McrBC regulatory subunit McrC